ncbi:MAG: hypothetical protein JWM92_518 [Candidatus Nomurabacteria bacterium]|nr:hypothetical protein [Candidatus Nomurabacteria bacterium]
MNKNRTVIICLLVIIVGILGYIVTQNNHPLRTTPTTPVQSNPQQENNQAPSPIVDQKNMVNARGEEVDQYVKAILKNLSTRQTFQYTERKISNVGIQDYNQNAVNDCITLHCKTIYFTDEPSYTSGILAVFNSTDNPAIGKIVSAVFYSNNKQVSAFPTPHNIGDHVIYTIKYTQNGTVGHQKYQEDLCSASRDITTCDDQPSYVASNYNNEIAIFKPSSNNQPLEGIVFTEKITEAKLLSYQYYDSPDTGTMYPVVTVQQ